MALRLPAVPAGLAAAAIFATAITPVAAAEEPQWRLRARAQFSHDRFDGVYSRSGNAASASFLRRGNLLLTAQWPQGLRAALGVQADSAWHVSVDNAYLAWQQERAAHPAFAVRLGRFDPDFGLEPSGSSSWTLGIERSSLWDLAPDVGDGADAGGIQVRATGSGWHASSSLFWRDGYRSGVARAAWMAADDRGRRIHLGLSAAATEGWQGAGTIRTRWGVRGVSEDDDGRRFTLAGPGAFDDDRAWVIESAAVWGVWSVQAEWLRRQMRRADALGADRRAEGHTVQLAWTVSGQPRGYEEDGARFRGVRPGRGEAAAWEIFARHDRLAVRDARAGETSVIGINHYPSSQWRWSANLLWARTNAVPTAPTERGRAMTLRAQWVY